MFKCILILYILFLATANAEAFYDKKFDFLGGKSIVELYHHVNNYYTFRMFSVDVENDPIPATLDYRTSFTSNDQIIKTQGACNSCFANAGVTLVEAVAQAKYNTTLPSLSAKLIMDCTPNFACDKFGYLEEWYMSHDRGYFATESDYPYAAVVDTCPTNITKAELPGELGWGLISWNPRHVPTEKELKAALVKYGPVSAVIDQGASILSWEAGDAPVGNSQCSLENTNSHSIVIVGYTTNAFICANSYGTSEFDGGYFLLGFSTLTNAGFGTCGMLQANRFVCFGDECPPFNWFKKIFDPVDIWGFAPGVGIYLFLFFFLCCCCCCYDCCCCNCCCSKKKQQRGVVIPTTLLQMTVRPPIQQPPIQQPSFGMTQSPSKRALQKVYDADY
ncbi:hypothetical protein PCE1_000185 [Barthelona sp. PCE]